jgi:hypothetical protein
MQHRSVRGTIRYVSKKPDSYDRLRGLETFYFTYHADGKRTMRATCELELPEPTVLRDVICGYDEHGRVMDAHVRLSVGDRFAGSGWYWRDGDALAMEAYVPDVGRSAARRAYGPGVDDLMMHPVIGDGYYTRHVPTTGGPAKRTVRMLAVSSDHRGATPPALTEVAVVVAYLGDEPVTVAAGTFATHHYQYLSEGQQGLDGQHPPIDVWVTADGDQIYVKGRIGGHFQSEYELIEYSQTAAG